LLQDKGFDIQDDRLIPTPKTENTTVVLVGDFVDKGKRTREMISFLYRNRDRIRIVKGNHENFDYKYLKGKLGGVDLPEGLLESQFTSLEVLQQDEELRNLFLNW